MAPDAPIDEIRNIRHTISADCGHDPKKLVAYYRQMQEQFPGKIVNFGTQETVVLKTLPISSSEHTSTSPQS
jgi:hypothetical protein